MFRIVKTGALALGVLITVPGGLSVAQASDLGKSAHFRVSPSNHIAARQFCLTVLHQEREQTKMSENRFLSLAHACSRGHFNRVFTELGGNPRDGLVAHNGHHGTEVMHEWERDVRDAIAKAPHLELK